MRKVFCGEEFVISREARDVETYLLPQAILDSAIVTCRKPELQCYRREDLKYKHGTKFLEREVGERANWWKVIEEL